MKIITICGSLKFQKEMMTEAQRLALNGACALTPVYPVIENIKISDFQLQNLKEEHFRKIELSKLTIHNNKTAYILNNINTRLNQLFLVSI